MRGEDNLDHSEAILALQPGLDGVQGEEGDVHGHARHAARHQGGQEAGLAHPVTGYKRYSGWCVSISEMRMILRLVIASLVLDQNGLFKL